MKVLIFTLLFFSILDFSIENEHSYPKSSGGPTSSESKSDAPDSQCEKDALKKEGTKNTSETYGVGKKDHRVRRGLDETLDAVGGHATPTVPPVTTPSAVKPGSSGDKKHTGGLVLPTEGLGKGLGNASVLDGDDLSHVGNASLTSSVPGGVGGLTAASISKSLKLDLGTDKLVGSLGKTLPGFNPVEEFKTFMTKYAKVYTSQDELTTAFNNFVGNYYDMIQLALNRRSPFDASFSVTEFMDLGLKDFVKGATGAVLSKDDVADKFIMPKLEKREAKGKCDAVNWTSQGVVPEVRKQRKCGCCYAMSSTDVIATQYQIDKQQFKKKLALSPQWMVDCFENPVADHCNGGRPVKVMGKVADFTKNNKFPLESCYKYSDNSSSCKKDSCSGAPDLKVYWGKMLDVSGKDEMDAMAGILQHGPVVTIVAVDKAWMTYNGTGILRAHQCSKTQNHAVMIVGYDYKGCVPYYIIKNSWGEPWGGKGHILLEAGKNACKVASNIVFTCTSDDCKTADDKVKYVMSHPQYPDCKK